MTHAKTRPNSRIAGRGERPSGKRPTVAQLLATRKTFTIHVCAGGFDEEDRVRTFEGAPTAGPENGTSDLSAEQRARLIEVEKTLLDLRRCVGTALITGLSNADDLQCQIGLLQVRLAALAESGDISSEACRQHAKGMWKLMREKECS